MNTQFERSTHTTDEWYTPKEIINALGKFDLDPCAPIAPLWQTAETMYNYIDMNVFKVGNKVHFEGERNAYTIRACDSRYLICTKPFNPRKTVLYTIVDLLEKVRGTENLVFCMGFETDEDCQEALQRLQSG